MGNLFNYTLGLNLTGTLQNLCKFLAIKKWLNGSTEYSIKCMGVIQFTGVQLWNPSNLSKFGTWLLMWQFIYFQSNNPQQTFCMRKEVRPATSCNSLSTFYWFGTSHLTSCPQNVCGNLLSLRECLFCLQKGTLHRMRGEVGILIRSLNATISHLINASQCSNSQTTCFISIICLHWSKACPYSLVSSHPL